MTPLHPLELLFWLLVPPCVAGAGWLAFRFIRGTPVHGRRFCHRCRYSIEPGRMACAECGWQARHERALTGPQRNKRALAWALVLLLVAAESWRIAFFVVPRHQGLGFRLGWAECWAPRWITTLQMGYGSGAAEYVRWECAKACDDEQRVGARSINVNGQSPFAQGSAGHGYWNNPQWSDGGDRLSKHPLPATCLETTLGLDAAAWTWIASGPGIFNPHHWGWQSADTCTGWEARMARHHWRGRMIRNPADPAALAGWLEWVPEAERAEAWRQALGQCDPTLIAPLYRWTTLQFTESGALKRDLRQALTARLAADGPWRDPQEKGALLAAWVHFAQADPRAFAAETAGLADRQRVLDALWIAALGRMSRSEMHPTDAPEQPRRDPFLQQRVFLECLQAADAAERNTWLTRAKARTRQPGCHALERDVEARSFLYEPWACPELRTALTGTIEFRPLPAEFVAEVNPPADDSADPADDPALQTMGLAMALRNLCGPHHAQADLWLGDLWTKGDERMKEDGPDIDPMALWPEATLAAAALRQRLRGIDHTSPAHAQVEALLQRFEARAQPPAQP